MNMNISEYLPYAGIMPQIKRKMASSDGHLKSINARHILDVNTLLKEPYVLPVLSIFIANLREI